MSAKSSRAVRRLTAVSAVTFLLSLAVMPAADGRPVLGTANLGGAAHINGSFGSALRATAPASLPGSVAVNTRTNTIYVADGFDPDSPLDGGHTVTVIDGRRCQAANVSRCAGPWPIISVGNLPSTVAVDEATNTIYVTNFGDGTVSVINGRTCDAEVHSGCGQSPPAVTVGTPESAPLGIFADTAHHTVYAGNLGTTELAMIDTRNCNSGNLHGCAGQLPSTVTVGEEPGDVDVNTRTHTAYVAVLTGVAAFDTDTCNAITQSSCGHVGTVVTPNVPGCGNCLIFSARVDMASNTVYASTGSANTVLVIDGRRCGASDLTGCAGYPAATITIGPPGIEGTIAVAVDAPAHTVYITNHKDDDLSVIDAAICNGSHLATCAALVPPTIHTGSNPMAIAVNDKTQTVYVGNEYDNNVAVISAADCDATVTRGCRHPAPTVAAGPGPNAIAIDENVHTAYISDGAGVDQGGPRVGNTVSMIDTNHCNARHLAGCAQTPPSVTVGPLPAAVAVDAARHTVYVADRGSGASGAVSLINDRTCNATTHGGCANVSELAVTNGNPTAIALNTATGTVYVAVAPPTGPSLIDVYAAATCRAADTTGCGQSPAVVTVGPAGRQIPGLAVNRMTNTIYATNVGTFADGLSGDELYVINGNRCDAANTSGCTNPPATTTVGIPAFKVIGQAASPEGVAVNEKTNTVYVADLENGEGYGAVSVVNGYTCNGTTTTGCTDQAAPTVAAGFGTVGVAVDSRANRIYATGIEDTSVSIINGAICNATTTTGCNQTPAKAAVGDFPAALAVDPTQHTVYVIDNRGTDLSIVRTRTDARAPSPRE